MLARERDWLLGEVLGEVSRAFYLTLRILPRRSRETLGVTYLVARAADTIADTDALPGEERLQFLVRLRAAITGQRDPDFLEQLAARVANRQQDAGERRLLLCLPMVLELLESLPAAELEAAREVLETLTRGMLEDLEGRPIETEHDLHRYTYLVAGCVGPFWTRITLLHHQALRHLDPEAMSRLGVSFGQALQLTNVLRDLPKDLQNGRCYLPRTELQKLGVPPLEALELRASWTRVALDHFRAAEGYALALPARCTRLRLAVLWPILIGLETLALLNEQPDWRAVKVPRSGIYRIMLASWIISWNDRLLKAWFDRLHERVLRACRPA